MEQPLSILQKYWKHNQFRPLQEDIIHSVVTGKDTLALLPTGGGKSVCFQVPALMVDGLCIVITPLIALMKDQVEQLKKKEINAVALHSGMSRYEIDLYLNNALYGGLKFLYVSPERLQTEIFIARVKQMKVGLIAVDEAHCISQWGYDFRPPYLQIYQLRELLPGVPVIALTASATSQVQQDIMDKLAFGKDPGIFKKSFARDNLSFVVRKTESKDKKLFEILRKVHGSTIIYVRSRKATQELSTFLNKHQISSTFYHAGLSFEQRTTVQDEWITNKYRVIVATNAFGMGIDKPDVRLVIHIDIPENPEAYYQEAGRGGRDGKRSFAVILYHDADINNIRSKVAQSLPPVEYLKKIYQALANYYQLALGSSQGESFDFNLIEFCERYNFQQVEAYNVLKKLEEEGLIQFNESFHKPSALHFAVDHTRLYEFQVANARFDECIKMLLRLYGGELFSGFVKVSETSIAKAMGIRQAELVLALKYLHDLNIINYSPAKDQPQITFVLSRQDAENLPLDIARINERRKLILNKMEAMISYVTSTHRCRMQMIQDYFDEITLETCGICDVCIAKRKLDNSSLYEKLQMEIMSSLKNGPMTMDQLEERLSPKDVELFVDVVREMVDDGKIEYDPSWRLMISGPDHAAKK